jgi:hypothetical protein
MFCYLREEEADGTLVDKCVLCQEGFSATSPLVNAFEKGLKNLIKLSKEREMRELQARLINLKDSNGTVAVHHTCRKKSIDTRKRS